MFKGQYLSNYIYQIKMCTLEWIHFCHFCFHSINTSEYSNSTNKDIYALVIIALFIVKLLIINEFKCDLQNVERQPSSTSRLWRSKYVVMQKQKLAGYIFLFSSPNRAVFFSYSSSSTTYTCLVCVRISVTQAIKLLDLTK
jgi:hypothetical protein